MTPRPSDQRSMSANTVDPYLTNPHLRQKRPRSIRQIVLVKTRLMKLEKAMVMIKANLQKFQIMEIQVVGKTNPHLKVVIMGKSQTEPKTHKYKAITKGQSA